jgi:hypothetical protein
VAKTILDLCGGSGSWSEPYRRAGYKVILVTLPGHDVRSYKPPARIHGILAAPPCTQFSLARTTAKTPRDFKTALSIVQACLHIVTTCRMEGSLKWWAMENPVGYLRQFIGIPGFTFNPYDFGDPWTKPTDLWGYYRRPQFNYCRPEGGEDLARVKLRSTVESLTIGRQLRLSPADIWAITPPGFARAFFKANP